MAELKRKGYADIFYLILLTTVASISVFMFIVAYTAYNLLGGIINFTIIMLFIFGGIMAGFTFLVWNLGRSRGLGLPGGKCEICGVEFSAHHCSVCGREFGPSCLPEDAAVSSRCRECNVCSICGKNNVKATCVNCGKPMCSNCYSKSKHVCIECAGEMVRKKNTRIKKPRRKVKAKTVILQPKKDISYEICQKISLKVFSEIRKQTVQLGVTIKALDTEFEVIATNPLTQVTIVPSTIVSVLNQESRDEMMKNRQTTRVPHCYACDSLAVKKCRNCSKPMCVRHQKICPECGKVFCLECFDLEKDICQVCAEQSLNKSSILA